MNMILAKKSFIVTGILTFMQANKSIQLRTFYRSEKESNGDREIRGTIGKGL